MAASVQEATPLFLGLCDEGAVPGLLGGTVCLPLGWNSFISYMLVVSYIHM